MKKKMLAAVLAGTMVMSLGTNLCWADGEKTKVTMTVWNGEWGDQLDRTMESFNSKHDDIELDITMQSGDYSDFLGTAAATNDWPDIYILTPWTQVQDFAEAGRLQDLSGMDFTEKVYPSALEAATYDGKIYGYPANVEYLGVFYNKQMFKDAGLVDENGEPKAPETWDQVVEYAKKLTNPDAKQYGIIFPGKWDGFYTTDINMASSAINGMTDAYDPRDGSFHYDGQITVMNAMIQMKRDGSCVPGTEGIDNDPARARFGQGDIGMKIAGSYDYGVLTEQFPAKIEWGVAPLPVESTDVKGIQYASADGLCSVNKASVERIGADKIVTILDYFTSDDMLREMYQAGLAIPIDYDLVKDVEVSDELANWKTFASFAAFSKCPPLTVKSEMTGEKTMSDLCVEMLSETSSPAEVEKIFKDYEKKQNDGIAKYKELHPDYDPTPFIYPDWQLTR